MNSKETTLNLQNERVIFNGHTHTAVGLVAAVSSGITVEIKLSDVQFDEPTEQEAHEGVVLSQVQVRPTADILDAHGDIAVYKHNNRFYILTGKERVKYHRSMGRASFPAKLVTTPALKRTREVKPEVVVTGGGSNVPFNPPRFTSERPRPGPPRTSSFNGISSGRSFGKVK